MKCCYHSINDDRDMTYQREHRIRDAGKKIYLYDFYTLEYVDEYGAISLAEEDLFLPTGTIPKLLIRKKLPGIYTSRDRDVESMIILDKKVEFEKTNMMTIFKRNATLQEACFAMEIGMIVTRTHWKDEYITLKGYTDKQKRVFRVDVWNKDGEHTGTNKFTKRNVDQENWIIGVPNHENNN